MEAGSSIDKDVVSTLIHLANAAKGVYAPTNVTPDSNDQSMESSLRQLFKSKKRSEHNSEANNKNATLRNVWNQQAKSKYLKKTSGKAKQKPAKVVEIVKDIFFVPGPNICKVPRKNERATYYLNNLVASAVKFSSEMDEEAIRKVIMDFFPQYPLFIFPNFDFVKAVDESLVVPNVQEWDFKTVKHIYHQGPIYIRSENSLKLKYKFFPDDEADYFSEDSGKDEKVEYIKPAAKKRKMPADKKKLQKKSQLKIEEEEEEKSQQNIEEEEEEKVLPSANLNTNAEQVDNTISDKSDTLVSSVTINVDVASSSSVNDLPSCSKGSSMGQSTLRDFYEKLIMCPICNKKFPSHTIQLHASVCCETVFDKYTVTSDDEDLEVTVAYEEDEVTVVSQNQTVLPVKELLKALIAKTDTPPKSLNVRRRKCWEDYQQSLQKTWIKSCFSYKVTFVGEPGIDTGGPKREFFAVCINQMAQQIFMDGLPVSSVLLIVHNTYFCAGRLMANSLLQGGPNPNILSDLCYKLLTSGKKLISPSDIELPSEFLEKQDVKKLLTADTDECFREMLLKDEFMDILCLIGYRGVPTNETLSSRNEILQSWFYKMKIEPILPALQQIKEGLDIEGLLDSLIKNPVSYKSVFTENSDMTYEDMYNQLCPNFSENGSNRRTIEVDIYKYFTDYLENCHYSETSDTTIGEILQFLTGSPSVPAIGFENKLTVNFLHGCQEACRCRATASTCAITITLPVHWSNYDDFCDMMRDSVKCSGFFGRV